MVTLKTQRLTLTPLSAGELRELSRSYETESPELAAAYSEMLEQCLLDPENAVWYTAWRICLTDSNTEIGYAGFRGVRDGRTEIGYGLSGSRYTGHGYAYEAVSAMCGWALSMPEITTVEAEAERENTASVNVLMRCGFVNTGIIGTEGPRFILKAGNK